MMSILHLASEPVEEVEVGRSMANYRAERQEREDKKDPLEKLFRDSSLSGNNPPLANELRDWEWTRGAGSVENWVDTKHYTGRG